MGRGRVGLVDYQLVSTNSQLSTKHSQFRYNESEKAYYIQDIGSLNGTYLNFNDSHQVSIDDIFGIGYYDIIF